MEKNKQHTVTASPEVTHSGISNILLAIERATGIYPSSSVLGGTERVNCQGKMSKRIKRNMYQKYGVSLEDKLVEEIGNIMGNYSLAAKTYLVEYTDDLMGTVGKFGDSRSCFQPGGCYHDCLLAMLDDDNSAAIRGYRDDGGKLARAWAYTAPDGAIILYNAYGLHLNKIAKLAETLTEKESREVTITSDVYINDHTVYAMGGRCDRYHIELNVDDYSDDDSMECSRCGYEYNEEDLYFLDHGTFCSDCYNACFYSCYHCGGDHSRQNGAGQTLLDYPDESLDRTFVPIQRTGGRKLGNGGGTGSQVLRIGSCPYDIENSGQLDLILAAEQNRLARIVQHGIDGMEYRGFPWFIVGHRLRCHYVDLVQVVGQLGKQTHFLFAKGTAFVIIGIIQINGVVPRRNSRHFPNTYLQALRSIPAVDFKRPGGCFHGLLHQIRFETCCLPIEIDGHPFIRQER